jgi:hypothetical protein
LELPAHTPAPSSFPHTAFLATNARLALGKGTSGAAWQGVRLAQQSAGICELRTLRACYSSCWLPTERIASLQSQERRTRHRHDNGTERGMMRRQLGALMFAWTRRQFPSWTHVGEYLVFVAVCVAGIVNASWLWIPIGAIHGRLALRTKENDRSGDFVAFLHSLVRAERTRGTPFPPLRSIEAVDRRAAATRPFPWGPDLADALEPIFQSSCNIRFAG